MGNVLKLTYNVDFLDKIRKAFENETIIRELLSGIGRYSVNKATQRFDKQNDPFGKPWLPSLAAIRASRKTLIKTGNLRGSIEFSVQGKELNVGTNVEYGIFHQEGTTNLPKRQFLGLSEQDTQQIDKIISEYLENLLGKIRP